MQTITGLRMLVPVGTHGVECPNSRMRVQAARSRRACCASSYRSRARPFGLLDRTIILVARIDRARSRGFLRAHAPTTSGQSVEHGPSVAPRDSTSLASSRSPCPRPNRPMRSFAHFNSLSQASQPRPPVLDPQGRRRPGWRHAAVQGRRGDLPQAHRPERARCFTDKSGFAAGVQPLPPRGRAAACRGSREPRKEARAQGAGRADRTDREKHSRAGTWAPGLSSRARFCRSPVESDAGLKHQSRQWSRGAIEGSHFWSVAAGSMRNDRAGRLRALDRPARRAIGFLGSPVRCLKREAVGLKGRGARRCETSQNL